MRRATRSKGFFRSFIDISIHALHEESDPRKRSRLKPSMIFQSTLSMRRASYNSWTGGCWYGISIHALHEESDQFERINKTLDDLISIHALHEESDAYPSTVLVSATDFNPRSP